MATDLLNPTEFISIIFENIAMNLVSIKIYDLNRFQFSKKWASVTKIIYIYIYIYISLNSVSVT